MVEPKRQLDELQANIDRLRGDSLDVEFAEKCLRSGLMLLQANACDALGRLAISGVQRAETLLVAASNRAEFNATVMGTIKVWMLALYRLHELPSEYAKKHFTQIYEGLEGYDRVDLDWLLKSGV